MSCLQTSFWKSCGQTPEHAADVESNHKKTRDTKQCQTMVSPSASFGRSKSANRGFIVLFWETITKIEARS